ncbi:MAG: methyltransferase family protein [Candidatus Hadarchaeaceae archaeon]
MGDIIKTKKSDLYFIILATLFWILALIVTAWDFILFQQAIYRFRFINFVGLSSILVGIAIRRSAKKTLGKYFSIGLKTLKKHELVKHGIYKYVRHPAYTGVLLFWFGVPLLFYSPYGFLVMLLLIPCYLYRIKIEEEMLTKKFGDEYREYVKRTKKLVPFIY